MELSLLSGLSLPARQFGQSPTGRGGGQWDGLHFELALGPEEEGGLAAEGNHLAARELFMLAFWAHTRGAAHPGTIYLPFSLCIRHCHRRSNKLSTCRRFGRLLECRQSSSNSLSSLHCLRKGFGRHPPYSTTDSSTSNRVLRRQARPCRRYRWRDCGHQFLHSFSSPRQTPIIDATTNISLELPFHSVVIQIIFTYICGFVFAVHPNIRTMINYEQREN